MAIWPLNSISTKPMIEWSGTFWKLFSGRCVWMENGLISSCNVSLLLPIILSLMAHQFALFGQRRFKTRGSAIPVFILNVQDVLSRMLSKAGISKQILVFKWENAALFYTTYSLQMTLSSSWINADFKECFNLISIISEYSAASGQLVNLSKSGILFSTNVNSSQRRVLSSILNISFFDKNANYLGILVFWGKSTSESLAIILSCIC